MLNRLGKEGKVNYLSPEDIAKEVVRSQVNCLEKKGVHQGSHIFPPNAKEERVKRQAYRLIVTI